MPIVLVTGAIASGKSAIGRALADQLHALGQATVFMDLDEEVVAIHGSFVWDNESDRGEDWLNARQAAAMRANAAIAEGMHVVISGPFYTQDEIAGFTRHLASRVPVFLYVLATPLEIRLERNRTRASVSEDDEIVDQDTAIKELSKVFGAVVQNNGTPQETVERLLGKLSMGIGLLQQRDDAAGA